MRVAVTVPDRVESRVQVERRARARDHDPGESEVGEQAFRESLAPGRLPWRLRHGMRDEAVPAVKVRKGKFVARVPLQMRFERRVVVRVLVDGLAPRMVRGKREAARESFLELQDHGVIVRPAPASVDVVLEDERIEEAHDRPARFIDSGLEHVDLEGPNDMQAAVVVVARGQRKASDLPLDFQASLL